MAAVQHNHRDWSMDLLTVQKFGKIDLDPINNRVGFSQYDIYILSENIYARPQVQKNYFLCEQFSR